MTVTASMMTTGAGDSDGHVKIWVSWVGVSCSNDSG